VTLRTDPGCSILGVGAEAHPSEEVTSMDWMTPTWTEIKMDAEIGSYQEDFDPRFPTHDPIVESDERSESDKRG
jgi:hypothetical protein